MNKGDLVKGKYDWQLGGHGIGIILAKTLVGIKVYWPKQKVWCYTSEKAVKKI